MNPKSYRARIFLVALLWSATTIAQAAVIVVNSTADVTANDGQCTLREAMIASSTNTASGAAVGECNAGTPSQEDAITFNIPAPGIHTIMPSSQLPALTKRVEINGYTQPGTSPNSLTVGNNAVLLIEIDGANMPAGESLFVFGPSSFGSSVRGLVINRIPGISLDLSSLCCTRIAGNFIGTDPTGTLLQNGFEGSVMVLAGAHTIGGSAPVLRNVIVGGGTAPASYMIAIQSSGNQIQGNYIGTTATGTAALLPQAVTNAIGIQGALSGSNLIGGPLPGMGNVIVATNAAITLTSAQNTTIQGNFIGTDATGTAALGGGVASTGIAARDGASGTIGGSTPEQGNIVSGFGLGIVLGDPSGASPFTIGGNKVGTDVTGTQSIPNLSHGILIASGGPGLIGGTASATAANVIAFNGGAGVALANASNITGWSILGNSIYSNAQLGISLGATTLPTPNDGGDGDTGANHLQNYPVLTSVATNGVNLFVSGSLNSIANTTFRLEFFGNDVCDGSGFGEGKSFLGMAMVTTDAAGNAGFSNLVFPALGGPVITSTATVSPSTGVLTDTSEFSACAPNPVVLPPAPTFSKTFRTATILLSDSTTLGFTLENHANVALTGVAFADALPAGLTVASPAGVVGSCGGGTITAIAASGTISLTGATLSAGTSCTFSVNVTGVTAGTKNNTTASITSNESGPGATASAKLTVALPPLIAKGFQPSTIAVGQSTLLSFVIRNPGAVGILTNVAFTDTLASGLAVTASGVMFNSCAGTVTAPPGSNIISLSGWSGGPGAECTLIVEVAGATAGAKDNSVTVTSAEGGGNTANAVLTVLAPPSLAKAFGSSTLALNATTTLTFTVANPSVNTMALTFVSFRDPLPLGLLITTPNGLTGSCGGGRITATAGAGSVSLTAATLPVGASCVFSVSVTAIGSGPQNNVTNIVTSSEGGIGAPASASVVVVLPPTLRKRFGVGSIPLNGSTTLTFTLSNPNSVGTLNNVGFTDALPAGLFVATPNALSGVCGNGTITAVAGSNMVSLAGATVLPTTSCTFSVDVTGTTDGVKYNSVTVVSTESVGNTTTASLTVVAPATLAKSFAAQALSPGGVTVLTFTLANPNSTALTGVGFTDSLPAGLVVSTPNGLNGSCGAGEIAAAAASSSVSLSGATIASLASCTFALNVTATGSGLQNNVTSMISSIEGGNGNSATAALTILIPLPADIPTLQAGALVLLASMLSILMVVFLRQRSLKRSIAPTTRRGSG